jgi:TetR/AcrR family fatty acid metabolism transcriptional regulator
MKFSESAIYRHFTSKEEIIIALLEYLATSMDERYTNAISSEQPPKKNSQRCFKINFHFLKRTLIL